MSEAIKAMMISFFLATGVVSLALLEDVSLWERGVFIQIGAGSIAAAITGLWYEYKESIAEGDKYSDETKKF